MTWMDPHRFGRAWGKCDYKRRTLKLINAGTGAGALLREVFLPGIQHVWFVWRQLLPSDLTHLSSTNALGELGKRLTSIYSSPPLRCSHHMMMCIFCRELFSLQSGGGCDKTYSKSQCTHAYTRDIIQLSAPPHTRTHTQIYLQICH